jgi:DNA topoisomerase-1
MESAVTRAAAALGGRHAHRRDQTRKRVQADSLQAAKAAGLRHVSDTMPGYRRHKRRNTFTYTDARGRPVKDARVLQRIRSLVIPPAWTQVWICPLDNGHLQVTGYDSRGRKQYRYHPRWRELRDETKYGRLTDFGRALPKIRRRVAADLRLIGLPRRKVLAAVVRLLESTRVRVGNDRYARDNGSFGLTTLRDRHVRIRGQRIWFHFRGKSAKEHHIELNDRRLARIVQRCKDLPGYDLFQYVDDDGVVRKVDSSDVNDYLHALCGVEYTAKDFRTWTGTVLALLALREYEPFTSMTQAKRNVVNAIKTVAEQLGNTPSVCRKCYVHPAILDAYMDDTLAARRTRRAPGASLSNWHGLHPDEASVLELLQRTRPTNGSKK